MLNLPISGLLSTVARGDSDIVLKGLICVIKGPALSFTWKSVTLWEQDDYCETPAWQQTVNQICLCPVNIYYFKLNGSITPESTE